MLCIVIGKRYRLSQLDSLHKLRGRKEATSLVFRDLELGAIRAHILHHAARSPVYGSWMLSELERHGYSLSYGTLYPALHKMEEEGLLAREERVEAGKVRKYYMATEKGLKEMERIRDMIRELYLEVAEGKGPDPG
jgi:PadR family transcriptional regulator, regulatory protein PadR